jgi:hypothetical protein
MTKKRHHVRTKYRKVDSSTVNKGDSVPRPLDDTDFNMGLNVPVGGQGPLQMNTTQTASGSMSLPQATVETQVLFQIWIEDSDGNILSYVTPNVQVNDQNNTWSQQFQTPASVGDFTFNIQATYCPNQSNGIQIEENSGPFTTTN